MWVRFPPSLPILRSVSSEAERRIYTAKVEISKFSLTTNKGRKMYTSFVNDGIYVFTNLPMRKAHEGSKNVRLCRPPQRKPKWPVPAYGI